ncbi:hypothetical protein C8R45DRAFT_1163442 [Mycena sanguinolenta]|nr:hypothetical protein C8R45DRAFT_1163442 [Mycena sanguinolenta]
MDHIGQFTEYLSPLSSFLKKLVAFYSELHKILTFVQAQQDNSKIKHFFRQNQLRALLKDCRTGLQMALDNFATRQFRNGPLLFKPQTSLKQAPYLLHFLPSMPQIFYGRESEVTEIMQMLNQQCARIAILGPGGIGKTNLARAVLHYPAVAAKYEDRLFVSCESATTSVELAGFIGAHLGLKPGKDLTKSVLRTLARKSMCLLVLDNLETTWEPLKTRSGTEDLLSSLTDISHLALIKPRTDTLRQFRDVKLKARGRG